MWEANARWFAGEGGGVVVTQERITTLDEIVREALADEARLSAWRDALRRLDRADPLEDMLAEYDGTLLLVSHDRAFLDRVCNQIVETERGVSRTYLGNYSQHLEQKALEREASQAAFDRQQKELSAQQAYIDRFRASATRSTQAKSREKLLDKVERIEAPIESVSGPRFQFPPAPRSGRLIAEIKDLSHSYGEQILFLEANLEVERGDRIAFVGPNGAGKSTLLRLVMGIETPDEGVASLGEHNVIAGYFEQNQAEALDLSKTVIDTLFEAVPDWTQTQVRSLLGSFCFSNDAVFKEVGKLSGGEKARLALALMLLMPCNLVVLDEPTSSLDLSVRAGILELLDNIRKETGVALLLISHDLETVELMTQRLLVLYLGKVVEQGPTREIFNNPAHPYTQTLMSAHLPADPKAVLSRLPTVGEIPSPLNLPSGCLFSSRCPLVRPQCQQVFPSFFTLNGGPAHAAAHDVACNRAPDATNWLSSAAQRS